MVLGHEFGSKMNILEAYVILKYSMIVVAVEIESKVMKI